MIAAIVVIIAALLAVMPLTAARSGAVARLIVPVARGARYIVRAAFLVAVWSCLALLGVQLCVVLLVSVFSVSVVWLQESASYLFGIVFLLGAGGVFLADGHVRVDVLSSRWSARRRARLDLLGIAVMLMPVCALVVIVGTPWAARSWAALERSGEPSGLHLVFVLKTLVPLFGVLLALSGFVRAEAAARTLREG